MALWRDGASGFLRRRVPLWRWAVWGLCALAALVAAFAVRGRMERFVVAAAPEAAIDGRTSGGTLVIAGGGELPNQIHQKFVELAGGPKSRIVVVPAVSVDESLATRYVESWKAFGAGDVRVLHTTSRTEADDSAFSVTLETATAVWIGGGSQSSLTAWYGGTLVERRIRQVLDRGGVVGGTSAGAAVMSEVMIAGGRDGSALARGFGLWPGVVIDQHFLRRNRWGRLQQVLSLRPELTGIGIDEETALVVERGRGRFLVLGKSYAVVCMPQTDSQRGRIEFLKSGDLVDLVSLREGTELGLNPTELESLLMGE